MDASLCYSCDYSVILKYRTMTGKQFKKTKCVILDEYVEQKFVEYCSNHSNLPSIEQIRNKVNSKYNQSEN
jgi:hypothetical protein